MDKETKYAVSYRTRGALRPLRPVSRCSANDWRRSSIPSRLLAIRGCRYQRTIIYVVQELQS